MRISDWSSDVCSSDLHLRGQLAGVDHFRADRRTGGRDRCRVAVPPQANEHQREQERVQRDRQHPGLSRVGARFPHYWPLWCLGSLIKPTFSTPASCSSAIASFHVSLMFAASTPPQIASHEVGG